MSTQRIIGIVLLVVGIVLVIFGINASDSVVDRVSEAFTGRFTDTTMLYLVGGIAAAIAGLVMVSRPIGRRAG